MKTTIIRTILISAAAVVLSGLPAWAQNAPAGKGKGVGSLFPASPEKTPDPFSSSEEVPRGGPRKLIAVSRFDANGAFVAHYGGWDIGGGLAAQLISELTRTGRFIVIERADLGASLREQQLGMMGVVSPETAAQPGQVLGAQLLIHGSVTEFDETARGQGLQAGVGVFGARIGIGGNKVTARVAIDLRIIDATTGQIVASERAEAEASQRAVNTSVSAGPVVIGNGAFSRTPLGEASRNAIARAVGLIVGRTERVAWSGRIVEVSDEGVYVNAGSDANLSRGQRLVVSTVVKKLTDPATGLPLGVVERRLGEIEIESVSDKFSVARMVTPVHVERGDLVRVSGDHLASTPEMHAHSPNLALSRPGPSVEDLRQAIQDVSSAANISVPPAFPISSTAMSVPTGDPTLSQLPGALPNAAPSGGAGSTPAGATAGQAFELPADPRALSAAQ
jgi:curli biogenesis system outer membrane secretion channel CsgG